MTDNDDLLARADAYLNDGHVWTGADTLAALLAAELRAANNTITELTDRKDVYFHQCELLGQDLRAARDREARVRKRIDNDRVALPIMVRDLRELLGVPDPHITTEAKSRVVREGLWP